MKQPKNAPATKCYAKKKKLELAPTRTDEEQRSVKLSLKTKKKQALTKKATPAGFEPARAEPNGLAGHRLNHSAKVSSTEPRKNVVSFCNSFVGIEKL